MKQGQGRQTLWQLPAKTLCLAWRKRGLEKPAISWRHEIKRHKRRTTLHVNHVDLLSALKGQTQVGHVLHEVQALLVNSGPFLQQTKQDDILMLDLKERKPGTPGYTYLVRRKLQRPDAAVVTKLRVGLQVYTYSVQIIHIDKGYRIVPHWQKRKKKKIKRCGEIKTPPPVSGDVIRAGNAYNLEVCENPRWRNIELKLFQHDHWQAFTSAGVVPCNSLNLWSLSTAGSFRVGEPV